MSKWRIRRFEMSRCQDVKMAIELRVEYGEIMGQVFMESTPYNIDID